MKKILVVHTRYRHLGGEDIAVGHEVEFLKEFYEIKELYFNNQIKNYYQQITSFFLNRNRQSMDKLRNIIDEFSPDYVYVHNTWFKGSLGLFDVLIEKNINTLLKLHNFRYNCTRSILSKNHFQGKEYCASCGLYRKDISIFNKYYIDSIMKSILVIRYGIKYYNILKKNQIKILVLTAFHKEYLKKLLNKNKLISVVPNYLEINNELVKNETESYIVYAGRISKEKGVKELIESFNNAELHSIKLKIIGVGPEYEKYNRLFSSSKIEFLGERENAEVLEIISKSKAVITATKLYEGQPTLLCEASLMGVASFYPKTGGISEFFPEDYILSFEQFNYEELTKKLLYLLDDEKIKAIGKENKKYIDNYLSKNNLINKFENVIND